MQQYTFYQACRKHLPTFQTILSFRIYPDFDKKNMLLLKLNRYLRFKLSKAKYRKMTTRHYELLLKSFLRSLNPSLRSYYRNELEQLDLKEMLKFITLIENTYKSLAMDNRLPSPKYIKTLTQDRNIHALLGRLDTLQLTEKQILNTTIKLLMLSNPDFNRNQSKNVQQALKIYKNRLASIDHSRIAMGCPIRFQIYQAMTKFPYLIYKVIFKKSYTWLHPYQQMWLNHNNSKIHIVDTVVALPTTSYRTVFCPKLNCYLKLDFPFIISHSIKSLTSTEMKNSLKVQKALQGIQCKVIVFSIDKKWKSIDGSIYSLERSLPQEVNELLVPSSEIKNYIKTHLDQRKVSNALNHCIDDLLSLAFNKHVFLEPHGQNLLFLLKIQNGAIKKISLLYRDFDDCTILEKQVASNHIHNHLFLRHLHLMLDTYFTGGFLAGLPKSQRHSSILTLKRRTARKLNLKGYDNENFVDHISLDEITCKAASL